MKTLVVFSHLRWDGVWQRPQQLMSRLAARWRVIFIEEPVPSSAENGLERLEPVAGVEVWRPHVTGDAAGFHDDHLPVLRRLLANAMRQHAVSDYWIWFYTPMAVPLAAELRPRGVVYDCMNELGAFRNAPRQLPQRESALLKMADLVFAGGPSLYNAKRSRHPDVHCFAGSVDAEHFRQPAHDHPLRAALPRPRLGFCGVFDERINLGLIDAIARARPQWQLIMVGPADRIDPRELPRRPNIHWLGAQSYDDLPALISGWDVCLLPYALNEATRCISPTKTLEYMACGRPAVSTSIRDVAEPYGHVVNIADTPEGFIIDCEAIFERTPSERREHAQALAQIVARTSWDSTVHAMAELIEQADEAIAERDETLLAQPMADDSAPLRLANAAHAVSVVGPAALQQRASATG
jgi:glycosyltransferase involved in cell wall biosynthesis